jgi:pyruvate dehydrogenase E1 component alpha subunit/2-oxoisovalerate dehydrogenase E1 component alpha subunit
MQTGASHEGLNIAAVEHVPLVVVATNNHYAYSTPNDREFACASLVDRARGYGFEGYEVDGTDLGQCLDVIETAVKRARAGRPPQLVVASLLRLAGHGEHDDFSYVPKEMYGEPFACDCVRRTEEFIKERELIDAATLKRSREDAARQVDEAFATAQKESVPKGEEEDWCAISTRELVDDPEGKE